MICEGVGPTGMGFYSARAESQDLDSLDGQIVSFPALTRYWNTSVKGIKANAALETKFPASGAAYGTFVREEPEDEEDEPDEGDDDNEEDDDEGYSE